jgi:hypothetical protein
MGFRFRRRVRILPGVSINFSKGAVSTSIGRRGATLNLSKRGARTTIGIPGTGISWQSPTQHWPDGEQSPGPAGDVGDDSSSLLIRWELVAVLVAAAVLIYLGVR